MLSAVASNEECLRVELCTDRLCALTLFWRLFVVCSGSGEQVWQCCFSFFFFQKPPVLISCTLTASHCWHARFFCWPFWAPFCLFQQGPRPFVAFLTRLSFYTCNLGFSFSCNHYFISATRVAAFSSRCYFDRRPHLGTSSDLTLLAGSNVFRTALYMFRHIAPSFATRLSAEGKRLRLPTYATVNACLLLELLTCKNTCSSNECVAVSLSFRVTLSKFRNCVLQCCRLAGLFSVRARWPLSHKNKATRALFHYNCTTSQSWLLVTKSVVPFINFLVGKCCRVPSFCLQFVKTSCQCACSLDSLGYAEMPA